jgi:hypothetical protein
MDDTITLLSARYRADEESSMNDDEPFLTERRLASAVEASSLRLSGEMSANNVASHLSIIIGACVNGHRDVGILHRDIADYLRSVAHDANGSSMTVEYWLPSAAQIVTIYSNAQSEVMPW